MSKNRSKNIMNSGTFINARWALIMAICVSVFYLAFIAPLDDDLWFRLFVVQRIPNVCYATDINVLCTHTTAGQQNMHIVHTYPTINTTECTLYEHITVEQQRQENQMKLMKFQTIKYFHLYRNYSNIQYRHDSDIK